MTAKKLGRQRVDKKNIDYAKRRRDALMMRAARATYQQVADKYYNGNRGHAYKDMQKAIADIPAEAAEIVRAQELELLDVMARGLVARAAQGDDKAVNSMLHIMDRRSKYMGLDTPTRIESSGPGGSSFPISINPALLPPQAVETLLGEQAELRK